MLCGPWWQVWGQAYDWCLWQVKCRQAVAGASRQVGSVLVQAGREAVRCAGLGVGSVAALIAPPHILFMAREGSTARTFPAWCMRARLPPGEHGSPRGLGRLAGCPSLVEHAW